MTVSPLVGYIPYAMPVHDEFDIGCAHGVPFRRPLATCAPVLFLHDLSWWPL